MSNYEQFETKEKIESLNKEIQDVKKDQKF